MVWAIHEVMAAVYRHVYAGPYSGLWLLCTDMCMLGHTRTRGMLLWTTVPIHSALTRLPPELNTKAVGLFKSDTQNLRPTSHPTLWIVRGMLFAKSCLKFEVVTAALETFLHCISPFGAFLLERCELLQLKVCCYLLSCLHDCTVPCNLTRNSLPRTS